MVARVLRFIALIALVPSVGVAEPGLVRSGQAEGQGWIFKLANACWVATAGHVVEDRNTAVVLGPNGLQGEAVDIWRAGKDLDVALIRIEGALARACPTSSLGDRDSRPLLKGAIGQGRTVALERRLVSGTGDMSGTDIVPMNVLAVPETQPTFTLRPTQSDLDPIVQSDSGSPIRLRGAGIGEAGLPLGLVVAVDPATGIVTAVRMDVVRAAAESIAATSQSDGQGKGKSKDASPAMKLTDFTGNLPFPECGPLNLFRSAPLCGWRVEKPAGANIRLALEFQDAQTVLSRLTLVFEKGFAPRGVSIATRPPGQPADAWSSDRYCRLTADTTLTCELGTRKAAGIKMTFDADWLELRSVEVG